MLSMALHLRDQEMSLRGIAKRLSLPVLAALCDIFECTPADLIATRAENAAVRKIATGDGVIDLSAVRPRRARIRPEG